MTTPRARSKRRIEHKAKKVAVVGAGVIGLSTAIRLAEEGFDVQVISGELPSDTTSAVAAAFWYPFQVGGYRRMWATESYHVFRSLIGVEGSGVTLCEGIEYFDLADQQTQDEMREHWWHSLPGVNYRYTGRESTEVEFGSADSFPERLKLHHKIDFVVPVVDMSMYLTFLVHWYERLSGRCIDIRWCAEPAPLLEDYEYLVNCTGYGAKEFVADDSVVPLSGQLVRLNGITDNAKLIFLHTGRFGDDPVYVVPRRSSAPDTILGGSLIEQTGYPARKKLPNADPALSAMIRRRCEAFVPQLQNLEALSDSVGLRPSRKTMRLEWCEEHSKKLIHNYGHGGGGVTLSWGCASRVCDMIQNQLMG
jgi:D-amino-acid oxidase